MGRPGYPLALEAQLLVAGRAAARARTHLDLWAVTGEFESRDRLLEPIEEFWEPLRFVEHAQLVAYCVTICAIYDKSKGTIRLTQICKNLGHEHKLEPLLPGLEKVKHLRDNIFAHRNISTSWETAFNEAAITPNIMRSLAEGTLDVINFLLEQCGRYPIPYSNIAREEFKRLLAGGMNLAVRSFWMEDGFSD